MVVNHNIIRSRDNIYEYQDSPSTKTLTSKALTDTTSIRSPSSLAMTQKSISQSSLKSATSLKESNGAVLGTQLTIQSKVLKSDNSGSSSAHVINNGVAVTPSGYHKLPEEKRLLVAHREPLPLASTPALSERNSKSTKQTNKPAKRSIATVTTNPNYTASSQTRTQVIEGIPQTSV